MKILGCIRPQKSSQKEESLSPIEAKTKREGKKITTQKSPSIIQKIFFKAKPEEKERLT